MSEGLKQEIITQARDVGFDLMGFTGPEPLDDQAYRAWLNGGCDASMTYMRRNVEKRLDPRILVPEVKTILCLGLNYFQPPPAIAPQNGQISVYAWGRDYHRVVKEMLYRLAERIQSRLGRKFFYRTFVDSAPVMEKALGQRAGLGWIGKNGCLVNRRIGSFFFLGELFLDFDVPPDEPEKNHCGTCTACLEACTTRAIVTPGVIDGRRCVSYLTIEHRGEIEPELSKHVGSRLFGCDACQRACPFNRRCEETHVEDFRRLRLGPSLDPEEILGWDEDTWRQRTTDTAGERADLDQWRRNAQIARESRTK